MTIATTEYKITTESVNEALRMLARVNPDKLTREDVQRVRTITSQLFQGAKSCAVLSGIVDQLFCGE